MYYDPTDPQDCVFDAQRGQSFRLFYLIGALCMLATLPFWYLALRMFKRARLAA